MISFDCFDLTNKDVITSAPFAQSLSRITPLNYEMAIRRMMVSDDPQQRDPMAEPAPLLQETVALFHSNPRQHISAGLQ